MNPFSKNKSDKSKHNKRQRPNSHKRKEKNAKSKNDKCHRYDDFSYFAKNCRTCKHLVALSPKVHKKDAMPAGETRYEAHFNSCL